MWVSSYSTTRRATVVSQSPYSERNTAAKKRDAGPLGASRNPHVEDGVADPVRIGNPETPSTGGPGSASIATRARFAEGRPLVWR